ncbi:hypothetical protein P7K49_035667 [Saguinus oedipus]|uniref:Uncharacterized protein n=1 Tax=Saguinus oedipus TaxID=9490 RepID=A0ABQ9TPW4_SAGOE|nr:hypothetical protein P7K49_035667 [Saguinus oedipus]
MSVSVAQNRRLFCRTCRQLGEAGSPWVTDTRKSTVSRKPRKPRDVEGPSASRKEQHCPRLTAVISHVSPSATAPGPRRGGQDWEALGACPGAPRRGAEPRGPGRTHLAAGWAARGLQALSEVAAGCARPARRFVPLRGRRVPGHANQWALHTAPLQG